MSKTKRKAVFKFSPFSDKQIKILTWWNENSPVRHKDGIIADGAIRSGKTLSMSLSFVLWAMTMFQFQNFGMAGKTIGSFRRNVLFWLKLCLLARGYKVKDYRADNLMVVTNKKTKVENYFYIFGGKDERSQDLIQGITLAGMFFDEVALMPESFVNQATGRCSVDGSKLWFNCNPANPSHFFKKEWIDKRKEKHLLYLHFVMDDNLSLSEEIKERYRRMYVGVFFKRYILGLWVAAEGVIYQLFANDPAAYIVDEVYLWEPQVNPNAKPRSKLQLATIGVDFGGSKSAHAFQLTGFTKKFQEIITMKEFWSKKEFDPIELTDEFVKFVKASMVMCEQHGIRIVEIRCDSAEQVLIRGFKKGLITAGIGIPVKNAIKGEIIDRIRFYTTMFAQGRYKILRSCKNTQVAFTEAVWDDEENEDIRLDDGTINIDSLDAQEYSTEPYQKIMIDVYFNPQITERGDKP